MYFISGDMSGGGLMATNLLSGTSNNTVPVPTAPSFLFPTQGTEMFPSLGSGLASQTGMNGLTGAINLSEFQANNFTEALDSTFVAKEISRSQNFSKNPENIITFKSPSMVDVPLISTVNESAQNLTSTSNQLSAGINFQPPPMDNFLLRSTVSPFALPLTADLNDPQANTNSFQLSIKNLSEVPTTFSPFDTASQSFSNDSIINSSKTLTSSSVNQVPPADRAFLPPPTNSPFISDAFMPPIAANKSSTIPPVMGTVPTLKEVNTFLPLIPDNTTQDYFQTSYDPFFDYYDTTTVQNIQPPVATDAFLPPGIPFEPSPDNLAANNALEPPALAFDSSPVNPVTNMSVQPPSLSFEASPINLVTNNSFVPSTISFEPSPINLVTNNSLQPPTISFEPPPINLVTNNSVQPPTVSFEPSSSNVQPIASFESSPINLVNIDSVQPPIVSFEPSSSNVLSPTSFESSPNNLVTNNSVQPPTISFEPSSSNVQPTTSFESSQINLVNIDSVQPPTVSFEPSSSNVQPTASFESFTNNLVTNNSVQPPTISFEASSGNVQPITSFESSQINLVTNNSLQQPTISFEPLPNNFPLPNVDTGKTIQTPTAVSPLQPPTTIDSFTSAGTDNEITFLPSLVDQPFQPPTELINPLAPPPPIFVPEAAKVPSDMQSNANIKVETVTVPVTRPVASIDLPIRIDSPPPQMLPVGDVNIVQPTVPASRPDQTVSLGTSSLSFEVVSTSLTDATPTRPSPTITSSVTQERPTASEPIVNIINIPVESSGQVAAVLNISRTDGSPIATRVPTLRPGDGLFVTVGRRLGRSKLTSGGLLRRKQP